VKRAEAYALRWSDHAPVSVEYGLDDGRFGFGGGPAALGRHGTHEHGGTHQPGWRVHQPRHPNELLED